MDVHLAMQWAKYIIFVVLYFSNFMLLDYLVDHMAMTTTNFLRVHLITVFGLPCGVYNDGGKVFNGEFDTLCEYSWNEHISNSPHYGQSNT